MHRWGTGSRGSVCLRMEDAKSVVCLKLPVRTKKYSIWKNDGRDGFTVSMFMEQHACKLQASFISLISLCTPPEPNTTWCQPKAVWVTPPRILHPGKDFTSFVALQNWKIIVISELCPYQISWHTIFRLSVSTNVCKYLCKRVTRTISWSLNGLRTWLKLSCLEELLSYIACSFNIYFHTIHGYIYLAFFE